ncbi:MAG: Holliday junction resolvase RuvX [Bacteroidota bacterium]
MGRILAIDFGLKRTGLAVSDELKMIASGLQTVSSTELMNFLENYIPKEHVETVVVGQPKNTDGSFSAIERNIQLFIEEFRVKFPKVDVQRVDERFTSKMAFQTMIDSGLKKKQRQNKGMVDEVSATIILQSYMYN